MPGLARGAPVSCGDERAGGPAHLQRGGQRRPGAAPDPRGPAAATVLVVDDGSPDGTAEIAEMIGQGARQHRGPAPTRRSRVWAAPTGPGFAGDSTAVRRLRGDGLPIFPTSPRPSPIWWRPDRRVRRGDRVAVRARGADPRLDLAPAAAVPGGNVYASSLLGLGVSDSTAGFRAYSASVLERIDLDRSGPRLRVPDRDDLSRPSGPGPRWSRSRSASSTESTASRRCPCSSSSRPWAW